MKLKPLNFRAGQVISSDTLDSITQELHDSSDDIFEGVLSKKLCMFDSYKLRVVPLDKIYRLNTCMEHVDALERMIAETRTYPPIVLSMPWKGMHEIIDGAHRSEALANLGQINIFAWVPV